MLPFFLLPKLNRTIWTRTLTVQTASPHTDQQSKARSSQPGATSAYRFSRGLSQFVFDCRVERNVFSVVYGVSRSARSNPWGVAFCSVCCGIVLVVIVVVFLLLPTHFGKLWLGGPCLPHDRDWERVENAIEGKGSDACVTHLRAQTSSFVVWVVRRWMQFRAELSSSSSSVWSRAGSWWTLWAGCCLPGEWTILVSAGGHTTEKRNRFSNCAVSMFQFLLRVTRESVHY